MQQLLHSASITGSCDVSPPLTHSLSPSPLLPLPGNHHEFLTGCNDEPDVTPDPIEIWILMELERYTLAATA